MDHATSSFIVPLRRNAVSDAFTCALLGLRDGISPRLVFFSVSLWLGACVFWALLVAVAFSAIKAIASFFAAWSLLGIFRIFPNLLPASAQAKITGVPLAEGAQALLGVGFSVATWIMFGLLLIVAIYATVRLAVEFWLMPIIRRVVEKHYPPFPPRPPHSLLSSLTNLAKSGTLAVALGLPFLLIPVANVVLLFVLFGYLNVRTLVNEALDGLASREEQRQLIRGARLRMILLGTLLGGVPAIPLLGLMTPSWIGAATCHLCLRELQFSRNQHQPTA